MQERPRFLRQVRQVLHCLIHISDHQVLTFLNSLFFITDTKHAFMLLFLVFMIFYGKQAQILSVSMST